MSYVSPPDFVGKMIDAGESNAMMSTRDTLIRAYMPGADDARTGKSRLAGPDDLQPGPSTATREK